ncbi:MAG TPA: hypothetical protein VG125_22045 [Pirellulales bacterium]|jgi:hypothetical protein|nr:hypothetical protein [Pirellulales bacterium]
MTRAALFSVPLTGWEPRPGERVIVAPPLRRKVATVKRKLLDGFYAVELNWGGWKRETMLLAEDLRPVPAKGRRTRR